jgi:hypothetical protein
MMDAAVGTSILDNFDDAALSISPDIRRKINMMANN